jgi:predicted acylesterase/phospholipase RssA
MTITATEIYGFWAITFATLPKSVDKRITQPNAARRVMSNNVQHICLSLSGGGHRAALFGAGALIYLMDAGKGAELSCVCSVSGGSLTNAAAGLSSDLRTTDAAAFRERLRPLIQACSTKGTVWSAPLTIGYLTFGVLVVAIATYLCFPLSGWWPLLPWAVALVVLGFWARQRGWVAERAFERSLFRGRPLSAVHNQVDHVLCATDFQTAEPVYFSGRFLYSFRLGWGHPASLHVARAVQASASLPGAFHSRRLSSAPFGFQHPNVVPQMLLTDGGVYDNMATEWPIRLDERLSENGAPVPPPRRFDELIVVNASAAKGVLDRQALDVPLFGEFTELLAVKDVLYDQSTAVRRRLLDLRFRTGSGPQGIRGTIVQIDRSPTALPHSFANGTDAYAERARATLAALAFRSDQEWQADADVNRAVKTQLSKIKPDVAARLMRHAYALTMANAHVLLGYPLLTIPEPASFVELTQ